ncbi:hypothetical protein WR25_26982 [Diploscapter pachys]|uniref:Uncharacterized protein n=1 Tax=Diploscapter pachys TaxID=2018661 RepID=A0A2A2KBS2_9BILA|nr:hypothetical protein WR25_26982 [Diploscapter pachys]
MMKHDRADGNLQMADDNKDNEDAPKDPKEDEKEAAKDLTIEQGTGESIYISIMSAFMAVHIFMGIHFSPHFESMLSAIAFIFFYLFFICAALKYHTRMLIASLVMSILLAVSFLSFEIVVYIDYKGYKNEPGDIMWAAIYHLINAGVIIIFTILNYAIYKESIRYRRVWPNGEPAPPEGE